MDCLVCRAPGNDELRRRWGCDAETAEPVTYLECTECTGGEAGCPHCRGDRLGIPDRRCLWQLREASAWQACQLAELLALGIPPVQGGWLDQSAALTDAIRFAAHLRTKLLEKRRSREE